MSSSRVRGRRGRSAFWLLGRQRLAVAVLEPTSDEPLLISCAVLALDDLPAALDFAPGILEAAVATRATGLRHVAALDEDATRLEVVADDEPCPVPPDALAVIKVRSRARLRVRVASELVRSAADRFNAAGLRLVALDCAGCALLNLATYLGRTDHDDVAQAIEQARTLDPLTAVSVAPDCEQAAARASTLLAVPVGLALGRFGLVSDG